MNLFSPSKLTLKLKNSNKSSTSANNCQKPEICDSTKSKCLSNNFISENDSFVEMLISAQSDYDKTTKSPDVFKTTELSSIQSVSNILNENKPCPVCTKIVDVKNFITHVKLCGTSHNLSSDILIKAVDLQERQAAEREALGLPKSFVKKKKCNVYKKAKLKVGNDSNLDLAIAMSMSLQESKEAEIIKESETLLEAGLEKEAIEKRKTLESFGFIPKQPIKSKIKNSFKTNSLLFNQTKENREKRITEKVAIILIDSDSAASSELLANNYSNSKIGSAYLNNIRNIDNKLWKMSLLEENVYQFYVENLSKFIKPCQNNTNIDLKNVSPSAVDQNTSTQELDTSIEKCIDPFNKPKNTLNFDYKFTDIVGSKNVSEYASKWKSIVGNEYMSDITVFTKDERKIPVHSLVFFVQCPKILDDVVITEDLNMCKSKQIIAWIGYSYEACLRFLELVYCGEESFVAAKYKDDYFGLCAKYRVMAIIEFDVNERCVCNKRGLLSKRKSQEFSSTSSDCKRYKLSSPDMFLSNDIDVENNKNPNFLGLTMDEEKSLGILKTKQWLYSCNRDQLNHNSSFTENISIDVSPQTICTEESASHSFHSASTISLQLSSISKYSNYKTSTESTDTYSNVPLDVNSLSPKSLSSDKSSVNTTLMWQKNKNINTYENNVSEVSTLSNTYKKPELITISDSDSESINMILSNNIKTSCNSKTHFNFDLLNEHNNVPIFQPCKEEEKLSLSNTKFENHTKTLKLNDNSSHLVHSTSTNMLNHNNWNTKLHNPSIDNLPVLSPKNKILIHIDDEHNTSSTAINVLPINNANEASNSNNFIDLVEDSSDSVSMMSLLKNDNSVFIQTPLNNTQKNYINSNMSCSNVTNHKSNSSSNPIDLNEENDMVPTKPQPKLNLFSNDNRSNSSTTLQTNFGCNSTNFSKNANLLKSEDNLKSFQHNNNDKTNSDLKQLENTIIKTSVLSHLNNCDSHVETKDNDGLTFCLSNKPREKTILIKSVSIQNESINQIDAIDSSKITILNGNDHKQDISVSEQIIDDPWMDYWQPPTFSPQCISPILSENNSVISVDKLEVQSPNKKVEFPINLVSPTSTTISNYTNKISTQNKNALTPNKFGNKVNTPKSLRRVQSESIIGSREQVTPLPDYSTMKTPDLRKEFDRYGLKDLGRHKGKLMLRHIYGVLHPLNNSEEAICNTEVEQYSDSSDNSEYGNLDYEGGSLEELETLSQTSVSNKISLEMGFKQLLKINEDLHKKILCYEPIWIEELKENLKQHNVNISMQKLITFLDDKCVTFRSKTLNDQRQKTLAKKNTKRKKLF